MIQETIVTTQNNTGLTHIAPMGIHLQEDGFVIQPFRPSITLENLMENPVAVLNYCDDVRVFAGCLSGRRDWSLLAAEKIAAPVLACALAHTEVEVVRVEDDATRPKVFCKAVHSVTHAPFTGFNRAQFAVLEAAILVSRLHLLPMAKIEAELAYLKIGFDKTSGKKEREAWAWLMDMIAAFKDGASV